MTEKPYEEPVTGEVVKPDPKKPWKAIMAAALAFLGLLWAQLQGIENWGTLGFQDWMTIILPTILTFGGTYFTPNPQVRRLKQRR